MPFILIKGTYLINTGHPDGDSVRFMADNPDLYELLDGRKVKRRTDGSVLLRYEGIDSIEKKAREPFASQARQANFDFLSSKEASPSGTPHGYILSRTTEVNGRPVSFVFPGETELPDGSVLTMPPDFVQESVNFLLCQAGFAYAMFYETLFAEMRLVLAEGIRQARRKRLGYMGRDRSTRWVRVRSRADLATILPIFPKLWRRMDDYLAHHDNLDGFLPWLEVEGNERLFTLTDGRFVGFEDIIAIDGSSIRLQYRPEVMVFRPK